MLRTFDREVIHKVEIEGVVISVKMFTHTQETNYSRFALSPYMGGIKATASKKDIDSAQDDDTKLRDSIEMTTTSSVSWASEADTNRYVETIAESVVGFEGLETPESSDMAIGDMKPFDVLKSLPYTFVQKLGRKIEKLSILSPDQAQD